MRIGKAPIVVFMVMGLLASASPKTGDIKAQLSTIATGAKIEVRLKSDRTKVLESKGDVSDLGFTLLDQKGSPRQIPFDNVTSVRRYSSHTGRKILIGIGIAYLASVIVGSRL